MQPAQSLTVRFLVALVCAGSLAASAARAADGGIAAARQRGTLIVGISYPLPAYTAGAKFRTPERPDNALAEELAQRLRLKLETPGIDSGSAAQWLQSGRADIVLAMVDDRVAWRRDIAVVPTAYQAGAMAILRSDTDIKTWAQLKGRTVCLAEGGAYVGKIAERYGAIEKVHRAPADALLALRVGACDAAVHDDVMLTGLLKLPEWQKFSARLPVQGRQTLIFAVRADDAAALAYLKQFNADVTAGNFWTALQKKRLAISPSRSTWTRAYLIVIKTISVCNKSRVSLGSDRRRCKISACPRHQKRRPAFDASLRKVPIMNVSTVSTAANTMPTQTHAATDADQARKAEERRVAEEAQRKLNEQRAAGARAAQAQQASRNANGEVVGTTISTTA